MNKNTIIVYICIVLFGIAGVYLTFFAGDVKKYDSQTKAYNITFNESTDSDGNPIYYPIYYFSVDRNNFECHSKSGSSYTPNMSKNTVYYDSKNPEKCLTENDKSSSKVMGIICLAATALMIYAFIIKKPTNNVEENNQVSEMDLETERQIAENAQKVMGVIGKVQLIYKRVILGIIIAILLVFVLLDTVIFKQTLKARNYIDTTAVFSSEKDVQDDNILDDYIYTFTDKNGKQQEIVVSVSKNDTLRDEIKIKYDENNPQEYYEEDAILDKSGIIWYIVKVIILILLVILFFNKKLLNKISISASSN